MNLRWPWSRGREGHAAPDIERASAEMFGRLETLTNALERLVEDRERCLREREQDHGDE